MKISQHLPKIVVGAVLIGGISAIVLNSLATTAPTQAVNVRLPTLSGQASAGKQAYNANCVSCHGANGAGSDQGPPLVHDIYNPGHHADEAFFRATRLGVPRHHWNFGNMPPQPKVSFEETKAIISFIRELQRANGIFYKPHRM